MLISDPAHALRCGSRLVKDGMHSTRHIYSGFHEELLVAELTFNFGPRKLIRVLRFEGSQLTSIRTAGYGYREKNN